MGRFKLTSPGVLAILALVLAGGIGLLDMAYLKPYVQSHRAEAIRQQALAALQRLRDGLAQQGQGLLRDAEACAAAGHLAGLLGPGGQASISADEIGQDVLEISDADLAWLRSGAGSVGPVWLKQTAQGPRESVVGGPEPGTRNPESRNPQSVTPGQIAADTAGLRPRFDSGLVRIAGREMLVSRWRIRAPGGGHAGELWLARHLAGEVLSELGPVVGGSNLCWVDRGDLPAAGTVDPSGSFAYRLVGNEDDGILRPAWLLPDSAGSPAGYLTADLPVTQAAGAPDGVRQTMLTVLAFSAGLVLVVVFVAQMLLSGPVVRVLRRLRDVEGGQASLEDLARDLRGEPLVIARRLGSAFDRLAQISKTDELTGLANRRYFEEVLDRFYLQAHRYGRPLSVMALDVDFFKAVNDAAGHVAGDRFLQTVAAAIRKACRKADIPARLGGDEFAVLLPETSCADAAAVAERIRQAVEAQTTKAGSVEVAATISIGIADLQVVQAEAPDGEANSAQAMVALADGALYRAKQLGRNRVVLAAKAAGTALEQASEAVSKVGAIHSKLAGLDSQFQDLFLSAITQVVEMLERRDPHMADNARKVQRCSAEIARQMELPERVVKRIETAAMLHDIGMLAMPDSILLCPKELDGAQTRLMRRHPVLGVEIMQRMEFLEQEIPAVRHHHERYEGTGYPEGLAGAAIPLSARILTVADAFVAMTSPRAFRSAKDSLEALQEIRRAAGSQFDPGVVEALVAVVRRFGDALVHVRPGEAPTLWAPKDVSRPDQFTPVSAHPAEAPA